MTETLRETGPVTTKAMWAEIAENEQYRSALAEHGLSADVRSAITDLISRIDVTVAMRDNKPCVETHVAGESIPRRATFRAAAEQPATILDLLRHSQFDRVVSAVTNHEPVYMETVPGGATEYEPPDLISCAAVAALQRMAEHVRKLEDSGLATYEGQDPLTIGIGLLVAGLFLGVVGATILYLCDYPSESVEQPEWVCTAGAVMFFIGLSLLGAATVVLFVEGTMVAFVGLFAFSSLTGILLLDFDKMASHLP
jgi:hypothetical protein